MYFNHSFSFQISLDDYEEAHQLLVAALQMRRRYMDISMQFFCRTTEKMLNNELPPSSDFCVPPDLQDVVMFTSSGDLISSMFILYCLNTYIHVFVLTRISWYYSDDISYVIFLHTYLAISVLMCTRG